MIAGLELRSLYAAALAAYLRNPDETSRVAAYEAGHAAAEEGLGVVDLAALHAGLLDGAPGQAARFFAEAVAPYEMLLRGSREANDMLQALNKDLELKVRERSERLMEAKEELFRSQKLEAIGRLAGGVAHDFNNLLTVIRGFTEMAQALLEASHPAQESLGEVRRATARAADLTRQLLTFSRGQPVVPRRLDLNQVVRDMESMLRRLIAEDIRLSFRADATLAPVMADRGQVEQLLMNLVLNARDAVGQGGEIQVSTSTGEPDADPNPKLLPLPAGPCAVLSVQDNGKGMDPETLGKIFEPFFTTKPLGQGTGLGLSVVYGALKRAGGSLSVQSRPGQGTTFHVYLALAGPEAGDEAPEAAQAAPRRGSETILVVEDDAAVRKLVTFVLRDQGYSVLQAESAEDGLKLYKESLIRPALVVSDLILPGMSGLQLERALQQLNPEVLFLLTSGYSGEVTDLPQLEERANFLFKPFPPEALTHMVGTMLDKARP